MNHSYSNLTRLAAAAALFLSLLPPARAAETACATVKMEVQQELTLERQAFDARMKISNGYDNLTLEGVAIDVLFLDEDENPVLGTSDSNDVTAKFFLRVDSMTGVSNVSGAGVINPSTAAEIRWLIIPAPGAAGANPAGTLYFVGATLRYSLGGIQKSVEVAPDHIYVRPMPQLALDYFLPADVHGDDPFTPDVEPAVPFPLGLRIQNLGHGAAHALKIESAQPRIVENVQGLLQDFNIVAGDVNGRPSPLSLLADFGTLAPAGSGVARWMMTTALSGRFSDFSAAVAHADALGGAVTSLIVGAQTHALVKDVLLDAPGRDALPDFLAQEGASLRLFDSAGPDVPVEDLSGAAALSPAGDAFDFSVPPPAGLFHARVADPRAGAQPLLRVVRSDGKTLNLANAWLSKTREGVAPWQYFLTLFDQGGPGSYRVEFSDPSNADHPPVASPVEESFVFEGDVLSLQVSATDPDGDSLSWSSDALPVGASLTDLGDGRATLSWSPAPGQSGRYDIPLVVRDASHEVSLRVPVTVAVPEEDIHLTDHPLWISDDTPAWTWTAPAGPAPSGYAVRIDGMPEVFISSPAFTAPSLVDGPHTFAVRVLHGTISGAPHVDSFGVDANPPHLWGVSLAGGALGVSSPLVTIDLSHDGDGQGAGILRREVSIDGGPFVSFSSSTVLLPDFLGPHTVAVRVGDHERWSETRADGVILSHAVQNVTGTSVTGQAAVLRDLRSSFTASAPVENGSFHFEGVPAGLYGLIVQGPTSAAALPRRLSLLEGVSVDVGPLEPGVTGATLTGGVVPPLAGVPVAAGVSLGQGYFLETARVFTDAAGSFAIPGLSPGRVLVKALPPASTGRRQASASVLVSAEALPPLSLSLPVASVLSGAADAPGAVVLASDIRGGAASFLVDPDGSYAVALASGTQTLQAVSGYRRLAPLPLSLSTGPTTQDLSFGPLSVVTMGVISQPQILLDGEPGVRKSLQACRWGGSNFGEYPHYVPISEEATPEAPTSFRFYQGESAPLCVLLDDPSRDIHSAHVAPAVREGNGSYEVTGPGARLSGVVSSSGGTPYSKPAVLLLDEAGNTVGTAEGGGDGGYLFPHLPAPGRYALVAASPLNAHVGGAGPIILESGETLSGVNVSFPSGPDLRILNYPAVVHSGTAAPLTLSWSGVEPGVYDLALKVSNDGSIWVEQVFALPSSQGSGTFSLPIPLGTTSGECYVYAFLSHKTSGWSGRLAEAVTAPGVVSVDGSAVPLVVAGHPGTAVAGQNLPITLSWSGVDANQYNLGLKVSNDGAIGVERYFEFPSAQGTETFSLDLPAGTPAGGAYIYAFISHKLSGWSGRVYEVRTADNAVTIIAPLSLAGHPPSVLSGGILPVTLSWAGVDTASYNLGLKASNDGNIWVERFFDLPSAGGTAPFPLDIPAGTPAGGAYLYAFISHKISGWLGRTGEIRSADNAVTISAPLMLGGHPSSVLSGGTAPITLSWAGVDTASYNLGLKISNDGNIWVERYFEFPSAQGSAAFPLDIPAGTPAGGAYIYAFISHKASGWSGRTAEVRSGDNALAVVSPLSVAGHPATVASGASLPVTLSWAGVDTASYNLGLKLSDDAGIWVERYFEFPSAQGSTVFSLDVPSGTPAGGAYIYAFISHKVTGWLGRSFEVRTADDVVAVTNP